jgi:allophanate hydrolase subunit 2
LGLSVIQPGVFSTIQDRGRPGYREFGVPEGGAFDRSSLALANALVGNDPGAAAIELTLTGGRYRASHRLALALAGAATDAWIESGSRRILLEIPQSFTIEPGDHLVLGVAKRGLRSYLAVGGGWKTTEVLGSQSAEARLAAGDEIPARSGSVAIRRPSDMMFPDPSDGPVRLLDGPDGPVPQVLLRSMYRINPTSNRVGLRLDGHAIEGLEMPGRASAPVAPGAVQVAGGRVLILGVAGGTMGGYPHVAHVISADLDRLGQASPGASVHFEQIGLDDARRLDRERRASLAARDRRIRLLARLDAGD